MNEQEFVVAAGFVKMNVLCNAEYLKMIDKEKDVVLVADEQLDRFKAIIVQLIYKDNVEQYVVYSFRYGWVLHEFF